MAGQPELTCPVEAGTVLGIDMTELIVLDNDNNPSNLINDADTDFSLQARFLIAGQFAAFLHCLEVPYEIEYFYDGIGGLPEGSFGKVNGNSGDGVYDAVACENTGAYVYEGLVTELNVPASKLVPGTYRLSAIVTFTGDQCAAPLHGFVETPPIFRQL